MGYVYNVSSSADGLQLVREVTWQEIWLGWNPAKQRDCLGLDEVASGTVDK